jgi:Predicted membrane protein
MIICPKCGAEAEGERTCPRCGAQLPSDRAARGLALASSIIGSVCATAAGVLFVIDYMQNGRVEWSPIAIVSSTTLWLLVGFPMLSYRRPALFLVVMGVVSIAYLWILERLTGGGWFWPLALPLALSAMVSAALPVVLSLRAKRRGPNIAAYILFGCTIACLAAEIILSLHFQGFATVTWSGIVAAANLPTAMLLLGIQHRLRPV